MSTTSSKFINAASGSQKLFTKTWTPTSGPIVASVLFVHGFGEHIQRYEELFTAMNAKGIKVGGFGIH
jgi:acylglycerol lipase